MTRTLARMEVSFSLDSEVEDRVIVRIYRG